jgi:hypothetical protein
MHLAKHLRRQHRLIRTEVDSLPWPHPRPAADPRLVGLHLAFIWTSTIQMIFGPPPSTVQGLSFSYAATVAFSILLIVCSILVLYAAFCRSQYNSFGFEMAGCVGFTGVFIIYTAAAFISLTDWYATNIAALVVCLFFGNAWRAQKLIRRLW